jgi:hypothetical protein
MKRSANEKLIGHKPRAIEIAGFGENLVVEFELNFDLNGARKMTI